jgi:hypothetical protein
MSIEGIIYIVGIVIYLILCGIFWEKIEKIGGQPGIAFCFIWPILLAGAIVGGVGFGLVMIGIGIRKLFKTK